MKFAFFFSVIAETYFKTLTPNSGLDLEAGNINIMLDLWFRIMVYLFVKFDEICFNKF